MNALSTNTIAKENTKFSSPKKNKANKDKAGYFK